MSKPEKKLSIVCPAYNEEAVLKLFHTELMQVLGQIKSQFSIEILYVDDGSQDRTLMILQELCWADDRVKFISLSRNFGHQVALTAGLEHATGDIIIMMDADLQHPPTLIPQLIEEWKQGYDIVQTLRKDDPRLSWMKRYTSRWFYRMIGWVSTTEMRAAASDFRLMTRRSLDALLKLQESHRYVRGMVSWLGFPTATLTFMPAVRGAGVSKYTFRKMCNLAGDGLISFSNAPLRLSMILGAILLGCGGLLGAGSVVEAIQDPSGFDWKWLLLMGTVLGVGGTVLMAVGIVGEYIGRIYEQSKHRPLYLIKDQSPVAGAVQRMSISYGKEVA